MAPPIPVKLPYFREAAELPGPLPTQEEIRDTPKSTLSPRRYRWGKDCGVCIIRDVFIVKRDVNVTENEGNALLFIEKQQPNIPVPRLYAMYRESHSGILHLVMSYLPGETLESSWDSLSNGAKASVTAQLRSIMGAVRSVPPPDGFLGGLCGNAMPDPLFATVVPDPVINGPFSSEAEIGRALARSSQRIAEQNGQHSRMSDFFQRHLPQLTSYGVCFTHGDLSLRNIVVAKVPRVKPVSAQDEGCESQPDYQVTGVIDWELAGWYPAWWEYCAAFARFEWDSDWLEKLDEMLEPYALEASMFLLVLRDQQLA